MNYWADKTCIAAAWIVARLGISQSKFYDWRARYGKVNEHNSLIPRDFWLLPSEKDAIITFHSKNPLEGLTYPQY